MEVLVLDEVDSLLQLGFEQQVRQVEEGLPAVRQKLFFSATIPPRIKKMATELLQDPLYITVGKVYTHNMCIIILLYYFVYFYVEHATS